ncbi:pyrroline-5-carboxylate reductase [Mycetocola sp. JXN-3]|uniref:pyrroline-5-carboxylate reductase n=1 Tax=Mycetocola sp. JXN-3 TaxID=2116510 RepID=UPI00165D1CAF|nr:pyrroline-5-carboxylate reductase [Mycetocola sp. JXN-3]
MTSTNAPSIAFLGTGSMGGAILSGLVTSGATATSPVIATNRTPEKAQALSKLEGVTGVALNENPEGNREAVAGADIILIGVKPGMVPDLLAEIAPALKPGAIVVSLAAGVTIQTFESILPDTAIVVRSMPNTPAVVGRAVTGIAPGTRADAAAMAAVRAVFETVGEVLEVAEDRIDALSTISGSGPAYVFALIEALTAAAIEKGFTSDEADLLVQGTFRGATELLAASDQTPTQLRINVTSPKGTTERALAVMNDAGLDQMFIRATDAALARAKELAAGS